ncbi:hypothetical protein C1637_13055 [Chryseobacterium lactis]|uniref:Uncharacterized protein n=1 Tax=Chryseobacterium lactis TaxID=1241981 RepID=A0A3G6RQQ6_CHRLC|nr:hypothetical protein EG342_00885 [Chryseobacterium lactis]AZB05559.1 hypothetical protein EG341_17010 [Chryseobacterium lactis]PNW13722.1 hypothetical protein C1637_13055 [Chryseobacterium lactis]
MKNKIQFIPLLFFLVNIFIYLIFHFVFKYDLNRKLYYEFHTNIIPILVFGNIFVSILFFIILYKKRKYDKIYYPLIPIFIYVILFIMALIIVFK